MSDPVNVSRRESALKQFSAMPRRAMADFMLASRYKVLMAICIAVDNKTGCSTITQRRISERTGLHRNTVRNATIDLEQRGYFTRVPRGRQWTGVGRGRFRTYMYQIDYGLPDFDPAQRRLWPGGAQSGLCNPEHKDGCADSDTFNPNLNVDSLPTSFDPHNNGSARNVVNNGVGSGSQFYGDDLKSHHNRDSSTTRDQGYFSESDRSWLNLAIALESTEKREALYNEAQIRGIDIGLLTRLQKAHETVSAVSSFDERVSISLDAKRVHRAIEDQIRCIAEKFEELAASKRSMVAKNRYSESET